MKVDIRLFGQPLKLEGGILFKIFIHQGPRSSLVAADDLSRAM
ncbi:MAG TPA: hypothetical protein VGD71_34025 [Kribbella sp.]